MPVNGWGFPTGMRNGFSRLFITTVWGKKLSYVFGGYETALTIHTWVGGLMLMYPLLTSRVLPGWSLNIAALLHKAEAILAISYIFIGHLRPSSFPMNEGMFSGSVPLEEAMEEKPAWIERL